MLYQDTLNTFLERVRTGRVCLGVHHSAMSPQLVEMYGLLKLDFVIIGAEVESLDYGRMEDLIRAGNASGTVPIVKIRRPDPGLVSDALNYGAQLVMVPHITSGPQLEEIIRASRFEPHGTRGVCPVARYNGYSVSDLNASFEFANKGRLIMPIIEDRDAMNRLDEIAAVEGTDVLEIGPWDLARSLGLTGGMDNPALLDAIEAVSDAARKYGKTVCCPLWTTLATDTPKKVIDWQIEQLVARGVTLLYEIETILLNDYFSNLMPLRGVRVRSEAEAAAVAAAAAPAPRVATKAAKAAAPAKRPRKQPSAAAHQRSPKQPVAAKRRRR